MSYSFDPELAAVVEAAIKIDLNDPVTARAELAARNAAKPAWNRSEHVDYDIVQVPATTGDADVELHVLRPARAEANGSVAGLIWFHGGGFVIGDARDSLPLLEPLVERTGGWVVSVQYRLSPETRYPGALDDGHAAYAWLRAQAGIDSTRIVLGGQSAGGALAAGLTLRLRDEGAPVSHQMLDIPVLDDRCQTPSTLDYVDTPIWNRENSEGCWRHYLGDLTGDVPAYAAPARADDLSGLPPTTITVNQFDPLRDEALAFASRLAHTGTPVELHMYPGTFHGSSTLVLGAAVSGRHIRDLLDALARALGEQPSS